MKHLWLIGCIFGLVAALSASAAEPAPAADATLPTPYTAEQIRDSYVLGLRVVTRFTTPQGVKLFVSEVVEWSADGMSITDQPLDDDGAPVGDAMRVKTTWPEVRDHAKFPAGSARREREERQTPLGKAEGWVYRVTGDNGVESEYFFADAWPGPPIVYSQSRDGKQAFLAEMIERGVADQ